MHGQINEMNVQFRQLEQEKDALKAIIASCHVDKEMLHTDIQAGHAYMMDLEERLYGSNKNLLE